MQFRRPKLELKKTENQSQKPQKQIGTKNGTSGCSNSYGYLANRPKDTPIPQECLFCLKVTDCMYGHIKN